jgi:DNA polymerase-3 subunit gamma/tau
MSEETTRMDLARRYRPSTLEGYIGNEKVARSVKEAFNVEDSFAYPRKLFIAGETGCGKTTMARILVRKYMCENPHHGEACGECEMCHRTEHYVRTGDYSDIDDVVEVDVGSTSGIQQIKQVAEQFNDMPVISNYKVFIFDEFQAASDKAQDALLKALEDAPDYVVVMFCTTDRHMVKPTIIGRCNLDLTIRRPNIDALLGLLVGICRAEGVKYETTALRDLCIYSNFIIRQTLQNLEAVLTTHPESGATKKAVEDVFDVVSEEDILKVFRCLLSGDMTTYMATVSRITEKGNIQLFLRLCETILMRGVLISNNITTVEGISSTEIENYGRIFKKFSMRDLVMLTDGFRSIRRGSDYTVFLDMVSLMYKLQESRSEVETPKADSGTSATQPGIPSTGKGKSKSPKVIDVNNSIINEAKVSEAITESREVEKQRLSNEAVVGLTENLTADDIF